MQKFKIFISIVILIAALFLVFDKLFTPSPIQITLESGQEVTTSTAEYFYSLEETLFLTVCAFLIGLTSIYLFYNSDGISVGVKTAESTLVKPDINMHEVIASLLKHDEKQVIAALRENNGEMQQNKLVAKLGLSKVKVTRILYRLEQKKLITKERNGFTNRIKLEKKVV